MRKQTPSTYKVIFSIVKLIDKTNKNDSIYFEIGHKLSYFNNNNIQHKRPIQQVSESNIIGETSTDRERQQYTTGNDR